MAQLSSRDTRLARRATASRSAFPTADRGRRSPGGGRLRACAHGLGAGADAIRLIREYGVALPLAGVVITLGPALVSLAVGRWLLKLEVPMLLGAIAGQQCSTPAISALVGVTGNATPVIGYTITYALSNVLLPLMGPVIVGLAGKVG